MWKMWLICHGYKSDKMWLWCFHVLDVDWKKAIDVGEPFFSFPIARILLHKTRSFGVFCSCVACFADCLLCFACIFHAQQICCVLTRSCRGCLCLWKVNRLDQSVAFGCFQIYAQKPCGEVFFLDLCFVVWGKGFLCQIERFSIVRVLLYLQIVVFLVMWFLLDWLSFSLEKI